MEQIGCGVYENRFESLNQEDLKKKSAVDCFQIRAVSHQRVLDRLGSVTPFELAQIKKSLALILDLEPEDCE